MDVQEIITTLGLQPHPEGGWFAETWRAPGDGRAAGTAIYFLLEEWQRSHWHRIDSTEVWHWYAGAPLELAIHTGQSRLHRLGPDLGAGERPQVIVPPGAWQSARPLSGWALAGCTVSPGFEFSHFELAPDGWSPE